MEDRGRGGSKRVDRYDDMYKILIIGDMTVGKTGLLQKFTESPDFPAFLSNQPTIGKFCVFKLKYTLINYHQISYSTYFVVKCKVSY